MKLYILCNKVEVSKAAESFFAQHAIDVESFISSDPAFLSPSWSHLSENEIGRNCPFLFLECDSFGASNALLYADGQRQPVQTFSHNNSIQVFSNVVRVLARSGTSHLSSRSDHSALERYTVSSSDRVIRSPNHWILGNPFIAGLPEKMKRAVLKIVESNGVFLKTWSMNCERNYWNSSLNGGLPIIKKSNPSHEGVFLLHDILHFYFTDPILDSSFSDDECYFYTCWRLLSEATTMVLADMIFVDAAIKNGHEFDPTARRILPLYRTLNVADDLEKRISQLIRANSIYAISGSDQGFVDLSADEFTLQWFKSKYDNYFYIDTAWNMKNFQNTREAARQNPNISTYYQWAASITGLPTLISLHSSFSTNGKFDVSLLIEFFIQRALKLFAWHNEFNLVEFMKTAAIRFCAGQAIIFHNYESDIGERMLCQIDAKLKRLSDSDSGSKVASISVDIIRQIERYIDLTYLKGDLLPHEVALYRTHVPHFNPFYLDYDTRNIHSDHAVRRLVTDFRNNVRV